MKKELSKDVNVKKSSNNKAIVIVLVLIIVGLLGFILCDKLKPKDSKPVLEKVILEKECNCPKCEEFGSNSSIIIESTTSVKEINITEANQIFKLGNKGVLIKKDSSDHLYVNNQAAKKSVDDSEVGFIKAYLTEKYIFFTDIGLIGEGIVYAVNEDGKEITISDNKYELNNIKMVNGNLQAKGSIYCGIDCNATSKDVVIKYANNTLTVVKK